jgi:DNA-binding transcriptional regulator YhcF (GntR family)
MLPFSVLLRAGVPIYEQVIYAVTKAAVSGQLRSGDPFPSVRTLSQELKINPNTAHKIVAALIEQGLLAVLPGIGTVVAGGRPTAAARQLIIDSDTERLVVEAKRAGLSLQDVVAAIRRHWARTVSAGSRREAR